MTTYSEEDIRASIDELLARNRMTWEEFVSFGASDELVFIDADLDFAYRNLVPYLKDKAVSA